MYGDGWGVGGFWRYVVLVSTEEVLWRGEGSCCRLALGIRGSRGIV